MKYLTIGIGILLLFFATIPMAHSETLISYNDDAYIVPPLNYLGADVGADSLLNLDMAAVVFNGGGTFAQSSEDIDAAHILPDGRIIFSTTTYSYINGTQYRPDDLILWDPVTETASTYFSGAANFSAVENIDAFALFDSGELLLSTNSTATLGGLTFGVGELVRFDGTNASVYFNAITGTAGQTNIDAVHVTQGGDLIISTLIGGGKLGGITINQFDLILWNGSTASVFLDGTDLFDKDGTPTTANLNAVSITQEDPVPEPITIEEIIAFFEEKVAEGALVGTGRTQEVGDRRLNRMRKRLLVIECFIQKDMPEYALQAAERAYMRSDGERLPLRDLVEDSDDVDAAGTTADLADMILKLIESLEGMVDPVDANETSEE